VKVAVTAVSAFSVTVQVEVPLHPPPLQPMNVEPLPAVGVSVTDVFAKNTAEHVTPHEITDGALATVPVPVPALETDSV
jgi:hypothetical protein